MHRSVPSLCFMCLICCVCGGGGGGGQIPDLHACCGYAGIYGMLQSTDEVDASSWSRNSSSSMVTLPSGIVDD